MPEHGLISPGPKSSWDKEFGSWTGRIWLESRSLKGPVAVPPCCSPTLRERAFAKLAPIRASAGSCFRNATRAHPGCWTENDEKGWSFVPGCIVQRSDPVSGQIRCPITGRTTRVQQIGPTQILDTVKTVGDVRHTLQPKPDQDGPRSWVHGGHCGHIAGVVVMHARIAMMPPCRTASPWAPRVTWPACRQIVPRPPA